VLRVQNRREFLRGIAAASVSAASLAVLGGCERPAVRARQPTRIPHVGFLASASRQPYHQAVYDGLRELGYVEGQSIIVEYRTAEGDESRLPGLVAELIQMPVDVIVAGGPPAGRDAKAATDSVPIVIIGMTDPVGLGWAESLARPGANVTGLLNISQPLVPKRLELLKEAVPTVHRLGALAVEGIPGVAIDWSDWRAASERLGMDFVPLEVRGANELERAFETARTQNADALLIPPYALLISQRSRLAELAVKYGLPTISDRKEFAEAGILMSYAPSSAQLYRRAAFYVDRIVKGTKPGDLPMEGPMQFELVINLKTAEALGLSVPREILLDATDVIR